ncbi:hypothetical protein [Bradyrhizobium arachidis]|uniref:hypothetical protein n=1 Tax=Bradyrhizobium arachidis TaxID=858423 RepID=UPI002161E5AD|nr:hypothetical protein [Bradyrhizobium arachidis]UVO29918.1 hypothetical protein KUF59_03905 [Bradyrhizobium arachidis]
MNHIETIKARALEALHADNLPTEAWALKNRVAVTVLGVVTAMLTEQMAHGNISRLTKGDQRSIQRDILKELTNGTNH